MEVNNNIIRKKSPSKPKPTPCETCAYYDLTDDTGTFGCIVDFDEDELYSLKSERSGCPHYKFYDEYKSVRKQN